MTPLQAYAAAIQAVQGAQDRHEAAIRSGDAARVAAALAAWQTALADQDQARREAQTCAGLGRSATH